MENSPITTARYGDTFNIEEMSKQPAACAMES